MLYSFMSFLEVSITANKAFPNAKEAEPVKGKAILNLVAILLLLAAIVALIYFAFIATMPDLVQVIGNGNEAEIEEYLRRSDSQTGLICTAILQIIQVISIVFPSAAIQIAAGVVYGTIKSFLVCHLASTATHALVFFCARLSGAQFDKVFSKEKKKASKLEFLIQSEHPAYMTAVAFLVPILPNGIIPYAAAKTKIKFTEFIVAVYAGSFIPTLIICAAGSFFIAGSWYVSFAMLAVLLVVAILMWRFRDNVLEIWSKIRNK